MKRLFLLAVLALAACTSQQADIPATAAAAIRLTDEAMPTSTAVVTSTPSQTPTPAPSPTPTLGVGASMTRSTDSAVMLYVPAGEFQMGYDQGNSDEMPVHAVYLDAFWIDKTEVTVGMYDACIQAGKCPKVAGMEPSSDLPVYNIDWQKANAYCTYAGTRLPTEAEWEKAARGTDRRLYPWGMDLNTAKLSLFEGEGKLPPVGSAAYGASPYGVLDMAGSAFEWVADWYSPTYYGSSPHDNPTGPTSGTVHVIRGGLWSDCATGWLECPFDTVYRSTFRNSLNGYGRAYHLNILFHSSRKWLWNIVGYYPGAGFRCAEGTQQ